MHHGVAVAAAPALAGLEAGVGRGPRRRRTAGPDSAGGHPCGVVLVFDGTGRKYVLGSAGRRCARGVYRRRIDAWLRLHGRRKSRASRLSRPSATMAGLVARCGRHRPDRRAHGRRLSVRPRRARVDRGFLFRHQSLAGLVAAFGGAHRSQHPVVAGAGAGADCHFAAGGVHGGVRLPRGAAGAGRADRRAFRPAPRRHRDRFRAAGGDLRCRPRELPRAARVFASG